MNPPDRTETLRWLREHDHTALETLWRSADAVRVANVGDQVHLRGLIELSNRCVRACAYCGISVHNRAVSRYRMSADEIVACAHQAVGFGYGTVVLQAGEDPGLTTTWVADVVRRIKAETGLAVTLSLGERRVDELIAWKHAGADRYLLRFETSDAELFAHIHPPAPGHDTSDRPAILRRLRALGYEVGSGVMVGIPGQTYEVLAHDLALMRSLDLDMIGIGPWLPHPATPLGQEAVERSAGAEQVPNNELMTLKMVALARLHCPAANIPSTTALATIDPKQGRELGLCRGANIVMPNLTPVRYRAQYEIYPGKACIEESAADCDGCIKGRIRKIGRLPGTGAGGSPNWQHRVDAGQGAAAHTTQKIVP